MFDQIAAVEKIENMQGLTKVMAMNNEILTSAPWWERFLGENFVKETVTSHFPIAAATLSY